jgi:hypothetical protein
VSLQPSDFFGDSPAKFHVRLGQRTVIELQIVDQPVTIRFGHLLRVDVGESRLVVGPPREIVDPHIQLVLRPLF